MRTPDPAKVDDDQSPVPQPLSHTHTSAPLKPINQSINHSINQPTPLADYATPPTAVIGYRDTSPCRRRAGRAPSFDPGQGTMSDDIAD